jgi:hypothetical protein
VKLIFPFSLVEDIDQLFQLVVLIHSELLLFSVLISLIYFPFLLVQG